MEKKIKKISPYKHVLISQQFDKYFLEEVFKETLYMKKNHDKVSDILKNKIISLIFYEASTRTKLSFETAALKLGAKCIITENPQQFSSNAKGESIEDTISMLNFYGDFLILRHSDDCIIEKVLPKIKIPYINAGSGKTQHPTQALLDVFTIKENFGKLDNLKICFCGDLLRGRTIDSLVYLLSKFEGNKFYFVSSKNCRLKDKLKDYLKKKEIYFEELDSLEDCLKKIDICYMTRIQKERFHSEEEYEKEKGKFILNKKNVEKMKKKSIIMHPLPRVDEISLDVDLDKRARYFQQAENGLYVRMALLKILNQNSKNN